MDWAALIVAGLFEVGFTTCLRHSDGFRNLGWSTGFLVCSLLSFGFLSYASRTIPLGTAYAVWVGMGAVGTALVGMGFFGEPAGTMRLLLLAGIILCVIGLRMVTPIH